MKFENTWTGNWKNAFRGLRHPMESYSRSDSLFGIDSVDFLEDRREDALIKHIDAWKDERVDPDKNKIRTFLDDNSGLDYDPRHECYDYAFLGPNDLDLAQRMIKAGSPNDKFLRQILVSVDVTAPLYLWKELDTYKVGTVANSTSTMHKLASTPITLECFEIDDFDEKIACVEVNFNFPYQIIGFLESLRLKYLETKDIRYWKELIRWLPESWLQTRAWSANYAVLRQIYHWRRTHKLTEWHQFCDWILTLPYAHELITFEN